MIKYFFLLYFFTTALFALDKISLQLLWKHQFEFAGFYIAKEKGYYKDLGLEVEIKEYDFGTDIVDDVSTNKTDIGIGRSSLVLNKLRGKDIKLLFALYQSSPYVLLSKKRNDLQTVNDFKNKKIMLSDDLESIAAISAMMKIRNIKKEDYTELAHSFNIEDLVDNKVDLMTTYMSNEPFHLNELGIEYTLFNPRDYGFNFYADIVYTSEKFFNLKHNSLDKFIQASMKGWEYAFKNIDETINLILKKYNTQNKSAEALHFEAKVLKELAYQKNIPFGTIERQRIIEIANLYRLLDLTHESNEKLDDLIYEKFEIFKLFENLLSNIYFMSTLISIMVILVFLLYRHIVLRHKNEELQQYQNELLEAKKKAEQASQSKSEFLANMSHEIRTPMTGMLGFIEQLAKNEEDPEKIKKFNVVKNSGEQLLHIINDILDFSKIESGKLDIDQHPFHLKDLLCDSADIFSQLSSKKNIQFKSIIDDNLPTKVLGDQVRLKQVIFNLLSNAVKFTHSGEVVLSASYNQGSQSLYVSIKDTGIGISKEKQEYIFEAFSQEDTSTTRKFGGTGLGLAISSKLVNLMGGQLQVQSVLSKGSNFYFEIPLHELEEEKSQDLSDEVINNSKELHGHILVVEDNKTNQMLMGMILDDLELTYDIANDGIQAVEKYSHSSYDLILMDENMPNLDGIGASRQIKEIEREHNRSKVPIIAVTANALVTDRERFLNAGMDDYIAKPYSEEDIVKTLRKYLS